jgi:glucosamine-phosphate N-acetyltransferase
MSAVEVLDGEVALFDQSLIPASVFEALPKDYNIRALMADDYERGVLEVLKVLTTVGDISKEQFLEQFAYWHKHNDQYFVVVITNESDAVVAVGSIVVERKLIHQCGKVGHIEDIAVDRSQQGKKLGLRLIHALTDIGHSQGAYKVILDCSEHNVPFYEKCGYAKAGVQMSLKFQEQKKSYL